MIPVLILLLSVSGKIPVIERIQFRTIESCQAAAAQLERDLTEFNARAVCVDRATSSVPF